MLFKNNAKKKVKKFASSYEYDIIINKSSINIAKEALEAIEYDWDQ